MSNTDDFYTIRAELQQSGGVIWKLEQMIADRMAELNELASHIAKARLWIREVKAYKEQIVKDREPMNEFVDRMIETAELNWPKGRDKVIQTLITELRTQKQSPFEHEAFKVQELIRQYRVALIGPYQELQRKSIDGYVETAMA